MKGIERIALLNDFVRKGTLICQISCTAVDPPVSFIAIKVQYVHPCCGRLEQAAAFKLKRLAIRLVFSLYLKVGCAVLFHFGDTHL